MRKLCLFCVPFCVAALAGCLGLPYPWAVGLGCALVGVIALTFKKLPLFLMFLGAAVGLFWFHGYTQLVRTPAEALAGQTVPFSAVVTNYPRETSTGRLGIEARLELPGAPDPTILFYTDLSAAGVVPGDRITSSARFTLTAAGHDERSTYYESKGIYLRASVSSALSVEHPQFPPVTAWGAYIARALQESARRIFPADVSGLVAAVLTGDKSGLGDYTYSTLQRSGAAHIVAVSGLHVSFFASILGLIFRRRSKVGALLSICVIFLFAAVAGFTPSVMRAAFMISATLLAPLFQREEDRPTTLSAALFVLIACNPYAIQSVSLQLSFGAVAGIYAVSHPLYHAMTRSLSSPAGRIGRILQQAYRVFVANLSLTLGALLFTTPLTAWYFGTVSLISPVTNLLILWAVSLLFSAGLILSLLGLLFPAVACALALPVSLLGRWILSCARCLSSLSFAALSTSSVYLCAWLVFIYILIIFVVLRKYHRGVFPVCAATVTLCISLLLTRFALTSSPLTVTMLNVGQGQCIVLRSGDHTALIDCGGNENNAGDIAADYLQSMGVTHLDLLVLTHCHDDHANGTAELLARLEVSSVVLPQLTGGSTPEQDEILSLASQQGCEIFLLADNRSLQLGQSELTLLAPLGDGGANEEGLFVLASCEEFDLLVTGDANEFCESLLLKYNRLPDIEVLAAGHHGSAGSTSALLLDTLKPEICLISAGENNYGHPAPETLSRLTQRGIEIYCTDRMGHLTVRYNDYRMSKR